MSSVCNDIQSIIYPIGYAYIGFRRFFNFPLDIDLTKNKKIYLARDPKDALVSRYFSSKYSHTVPEYGLIRERILEKRKNIKDREMSYYFDDYLENAGSNYFPFIGSLSNYFNHTSYWQKIKHYNEIDIYTIKYEKMLENPVAEFSPFTEKVLNISEEKLSKAIKIAERKTKKDGKLFWRKEPNSYMHFLTTEQINQFNKKYKIQLETLGY